MSFVFFDRNHNKTNKSCVIQTKLYKKYQTIHVTTTYVSFLWFCEWCVCIFSILLLYGSQSIVLNNKSGSRVLCNLTVSVLFRSSLEKCIRINKKVFVEEVNQLSFLSYLDQEKQQFFGLKILLSLSRYFLILFKSALFCLILS